VCEDGIQNRLLAIDRKELYILAKQITVDYLTDILFDEVNVDIGDSRQTASGSLSPAVPIERPLE
jgi:hypothetical protein